MTASVTASVAASHRLSIAPMMECTDRHFRMLVRLISRHTRLYTEMVTANALVRGRDPQRFLAYAGIEHPVALQLGGSEPALLAAAANMAAKAGFDEINLNAGCPSDRVTTGRFGACLMAEPVLVADCVAAMRAAIGGAVPVTVKTRIGIDHHDSDAFLDDFVGHVSSAGCSTFIIHARKAWLNGLSPKENREIPPLRYERAAKLKRDFPHLTVILNGGLRSLDDVAAHLPAVDGCMIGRRAYEAPYALLADADARLFADPAPVAPESVVALRYLDYAAAELAGGARLHSVTRHAMGLFAGRPGARKWRRALACVNQTVCPDDALRELRAIVTGNLNQAPLCLGESLAA